MCYTFEIVNMNFIEALCVFLFPFLFLCTSCHEEKNLQLNVNKSNSSTENVRNISEENLEVYNNLLEQNQTTLESKKQTSSTDDDRKSNIIEYKVANGTRNELNVESKSLDSAPLKTTESTTEKYDFQYSDVKGDEKSNIKKLSNKINYNEIFVNDSPHSLKDDDKFAQTRISDSYREKGEIAFNLYVAEMNKTRPNKLHAFELLKSAVALNNSKAKEKFCWTLLFGYFTKQNISEAMDMSKHLADLGSPEAQMILGFLYATGLGVASSQAKALVYYTFAALGGQPWAQMAMGYRYWAGIGVASSCESSLSYYKKVATTVAEKVSINGGMTVQRVRLLDELETYGSGTSEDDIIQYFEHLAGNGDTQAQVGLGQLYYQGRKGIQPDHAAALHYFKAAADVGDPNGMAFLGKMYLEGSDVVPQNIKLALKYFRKAADHENAVGQGGLGIMYLKGLGVPQDYNRAFKFFLQAAQQGWVDGQLQLDGLGVKQDYRTAIKYFNQASHSGHVLAFYYLAKMHASGTGVLRSCSVAVELFKDVAERGRWGELLMEAHKDYRTGKIKEALARYMLLSELGYEVAQGNVAYILDRNESTFWDMKESYQRALQYWMRAANQGYAAARVRVGDYHYYGFGIPKDYSVAAAHYRIASEQQHSAQAMFNLGYMHEQGLGMKKDLHLAKRFYDMAADASPDAQVPVTLALTKLSFIFGMTYIAEQMSFLSNFKIINLIGQDWDLYLITLLVLAIGILLYIRRN